MEDDPNFFENGRQPQTHEIIFFENGRRHIFLKNGKHLHFFEKEDNLKIFEIGRRPYFCKLKATSIFSSKERRPQHT